MSRGVLVEVSQRRAAFLRESVVELGLGDRVEVLEERGESVGRLPQYREQLELVTARSFAAPSLTAEIAAGIVAIDGILVVSEPPEHDERRWPSSQLDGLGFGPAEIIEVDVAHFALLRKSTGVPERLPPRGRAAGQASPLVMFHVKHRGPSLRPLGRIWGADLLRVH